MSTMTQASRIGHCGRTSQTAMLWWVGPAADVADVNQIVLPVSVPSPFDAAQK